MSKRKLILCFIDIACLIAVFLFAVALASSGLIRSLIINTVSIENPLIVGLNLFGMTSLLVLFRLFFKIYKYIWRYAWPGTYLRLVLADACAGLSASVIAFFLPQYTLGFTIVLVIYCINCLVSLSARSVYQVFYAHRNAKEEKDNPNNNRINIAIVGAGNVGSALAQELMQNPKSHYRAICFIDKDIAKTGMFLNGLPVYPVEKSVERIRKLPIQEVVIAIPDSDGDTKKALYDIYRETGCKVKIYDYPLNSKNKSAGRSIREINIEDLLFRETIDIDNQKSKDFYRDKTVLVTGGGGSIGSELCRQIAKLKPKKLVIVDIYENNAYNIQQELIREYGSDINLSVLIASVRDVKRLDEIFDKYRPDVVLHAAAHKHVPLMEKSPMEAIKNNVFGTYNTANMAEKYGVQKFVLISTDKAVNPTNIMGASKRLCEMVIQCRTDSKTKFVAVRFGNVLGSNGSVIPLFQSQIEKGGPITITDKRIIRYFMTIPEASQLVLEAGAIAKKGELFVLDMGKPVRIYDLALSMIKFAGLTLGEDIDIVEVGLRPGEKLYEELLMRSENLDTTENSLIFVEKNTPNTRQEVEDKLSVLSKAVELSTYKAVKEAIISTVPTFHEPEELNNQAEDVINKQRSLDGDAYTHEMFAAK